MLTSANIVHHSHHHFDQVHRPPSRGVRRKLRTPRTKLAPPHTRRTRSQTAILTGTIPSRLNYRLAARSGFAASAASASTSLRPSLPPCSARLGCTTSDRLALNNTPLTSPAPKPDSPPHAAPLPTPSEYQLHFPQPMVHSPTHPEHNPDSPPHIVSPHPAATDINVEAAGLSESLLCYEHRD